ncbi:MAG: cbb3-type cytochrome c oxidase subunit 3 [Verrucomicrobiales bacterium]|jgi:hypothetical protein|nr:cbb3-type cytochrome c oxidase subunit 3 [bacterium]MDF2377185.1 cbb3-type cytochrome c oxidase subunit 3 [Verrucomicrobiales bacterium]
MYRRVTLEGWQEIVPYICFALIAGAFLVILIRALRMKKKDIDHLSNMPLRDDNELQESIENQSDEDQGSK